MKIIIDQTKTSKENPSFDTMLKSKKIEKNILKWNKIECEGKKFSYSSIDPGTFPSFIYKLMIENTKE